MTRTLCLCLILVVGCSAPTAAPGTGEKASKDNAAKLDKPEVRFEVLVKPTELDVLAGQDSVEPTVVLYWKARSQWAKGADPDVSLSARVEPPGKGVSVKLGRAKEAPPPADKEIEIPIRVSIGVSQTAPTGEYVVEITATIPGGDPRSATIKVRVPSRE